MSSPISDVFHQSDRPLIQLDRAVAHGQSENIGEIQIRHETSAIVTGSFVHVLDLFKALGEGSGGSFEKGVVVPFGSMT